MKEKVYPSKLAKKFCSDPFNVKVLSVLSSLTQNSMIELLDYFVRALFWPQRFLIRSNGKAFLQKLLFCLLIINEIFFEFNFVKRLYGTKAYISQILVIIYVTLNNKVVQRCLENL